MRRWHRYATNPMFLQMHDRRLVRTTRRTLRWFHFWAPA